jgi:hypothetical protein
MTCPPQGSHFLPTFCWLGQKVGRLAGRVPPVLGFKLLRVLRDKP